MSAPGNRTGGGADALGAFWTEFARLVASAPFQTAGPEAFQQMRRALLDTMAQQADAFLRSEAFLNAMKQTLDSSLAWQQMVNQYLQKGLSAMQMPTGADTGQIAQLVRGLEQRLSRRIDALERRLERAQPARASASRRGARPAGAATRSRTQRKPARAARGSRRR